MITVYSKDNCPKCVQAFSILDSKNQQYKVIKIVDDVSDDENEMSRDEFVYMYPGIRQMPYFIDSNGKYHTNVMSLMTTF